MLPEIPAQHRPLLHNLLYHGIVLPAMRSSLANVRLNTQALPSPDDNPLIIYLTHVSWWDAYMIYLMMDRLLPKPRQSYVMMEAKQLRRYRFFRWSGAFSIERSNARDILRSLVYITERLQEQPGRVLWIFPQGEIVHPDLRPISLYAGITHIIRRLGSATLWPIALRYELAGEQRAEALIRAGTPYRVTASQGEAQIISDCTTRLTALSDNLREDAIHKRYDQYRTLLRGQVGIDQWFDQIRGMRG